MKLRSIDLIENNNNQNNINQNNFENNTKQNNNQNNFENNNKQNNNNQNNFENNRTLIVGPSFCGKTHLLINILKIKKIDDPDKKNSYYNSKSRTIFKFGHTHWNWRQLRG